VQGVAEEAAAQAREASDAATRQTRSLEGLAETSRGLALLAERLRRSTGRFKVPSPGTEPPTAEMPMPNEVRLGSNAALGVTGTSLTAA
jgi:hypothetical protein